MKNQTAMQQLLNQLRVERNTLPMDVEWNRCFQAIESVIESKYIAMEKEQIMDAYEMGRFNFQVNKGYGNNKTPVDYYIENYL